MKKVFNYVFVMLGAFFIFSMSSYAKENIDINFDRNREFNFFYELKENTPMYQFINQHGKDLPDHLFGIAGREYPYIFIEQLDNPPNEYPTARYRFVLGGWNNDLLSLNYKEGRYYFKYDSGSHTNHFTYVYYNDNAELLGIELVNGMDLDYFPVSNNSTSWIPPEDFQYIISSLIYAKSSKSVACYGCNSMRTNKLVINNESYTFSTDINSGWINFWKKVGHSIKGYESTNLSNYGLDYFDKNYYYDENKGVVTPLLDILYYDKTYESLSVPSDYLSKSFNYDDRYFLVPNSKTCTDKDKLLYLSGSDISSVHFINYSLLQNDSLSNDFGSYSYKIKQANTIYALSLKNVIPSDTNINDYVYYIFSSNNFSSNIIYYNPNCFDMYDAVSSTDLSFTNVNTDSVITLTPNEQKIFYNDNSDLVDDIVKESENQSPNVDIKTIISGAWDGAKSIVSSSYYLMDLSTNLFERLPSEISSLLVICFTIGIIVILWKVFRG